MLGKFERYSATGSDERQLYWHAVNCSKVKIFIGQIITGENKKKKTEKITVKKITRWYKRGKQSYNLGHMMLGHTTKKKPNFCTLPDKNAFLSYNVICGNIRKVLTLIYN